VATPSATVEGIGHIFSPDYESDAFSGPPPPADWHLSNAGDVVLSSFVEAHFGRTSGWGFCAEATPGRRLDDDGLAGLEHGLCAALEGFEAPIFSADEVLSRFAWLAPA
jgi:hypothetical protein